METECSLAGCAPGRFVLANARLVLPDSVEQSCLVVSNGHIEQVGVPGDDLAAIDCQGDYVLPGLVEIHTDSLERHLQPQPGVDRDPLQAFISHDREMIGVGITTVLNAVAVGDTVPGGFRTRLLAKSLDGAASAQSRCLAQHLVHLRCELSDPEASALFASACDHSELRLVSLMDHTPGQRQWRDLVRFREVYGAKHGLGARELDRLTQTRRVAHELHVPGNRQRILQMCRSRGLRLASHDDTEVEHVREAHADGVSICEFPTTMAAAQEASRLGQAIVMGAPNVLRGGSHAGNVPAIDLLREGLVDILSSDYQPNSLLAAAFRLPSLCGTSLQAAVRMVTLAPATILGLEDRGSLVSGRRADLIRVRESPDGITVVGVWRAGIRVV